MSPGLLAFDACFTSMFTCRFHWKSCGKWIRRKMLTLRLWLSCKHILHLYTCTIHLQGVCVGAIRFFLLLAEGPLELGSILTRWTPGGCPPFVSCHHRDVPSKASHHALGRDRPVTSGFACTCSKPHRRAPLVSHPLVHLDGVSIPTTPALHPVAIVLDVGSLRPERIPMLGLIHDFEVSLLQGSCGLRQGIHCDLEIWLLFCCNPNRNKLTKTAKSHCMPCLPIGEMGV